MAIPSTPTTIEVEAVNEILMSIGQAPVSKLEQTNPDVAIAYETLMQVSKEVQSEGWTFNKEYHLSSFVPDANTKHITIPSNVLQIDLSDDHSNRDKDSVVREGKLYDRYNHTYEWSTTPEVDVMYLMNFDDVPTVIRKYIVARAAKISSSRVVGDNQQYQFLAEKEALCRATADEYECNQGDFSFFGMQKGNDYYISYKPYHALFR